MNMLKPPANNINHHQPPPWMLLPHLTRLLAPISVVARLPASVQPFSRILLNMRSSRTVQSPSVANFSKYIYVEIYIIPKKKILVFHPKSLLYRFVRRQPFLSLRGLQRPQAAW
jgi:hypothetical protein